MNNKYEIKNEVVYITIKNKKGIEFITQIDKEYFDLINESESIFAEWNKNINNYYAQSLKAMNIDGKLTSVKQSIQSIILNINNKVPIKHINDNTLDNRKANLEIIERKKINDYEEIDENTIAILLKNKYGKVEGTALISKDDFGDIINDTYSWVFYKHNNKSSVVANTPEGRIFLDKLIMKPTEGMIIHHINLNPLDNRRSNLELKSDVDLPNKVHTK